MGRLLIWLGLRLGFLLGSMGFLVLGDGFLGGLGDLGMGIFVGCTGSLMRLLCLLLQYISMRNQSTIQYNPHNPLYSPNNNPKVAEPNI